MKKFVCFFICVLLLITTCVCCTDQLSIKFKNCISEIRYNLFDFKNEDVYINFISGERESEYLLNGVHTKNIEFGLLTIYIINKNIENRNTSYKLVIDDIEYSGDFETNPYDNSLVADINKIISDDSQILLTLIINDYALVENLENKSNNWKIDYNKVISLGFKELKPSIKKYLKDGELNCEGYVKIMYDTTTFSGQYFWYVSIVGIDKEKEYFVFDVYSGELINKKLL